jgi:hypothetical protein
LIDLILIIALVPDGCSKFFLLEAVNIPVPAGSALDYLRRRNDVQVRRSGSVPGRPTNMEEALG